MINESASHQDIGRSISEQERRQLTLEHVARAQQELRSKMSQAELSAAARKLEEDGVLSVRESGNGVSIDRSYYVYSPDSVLGITVFEEHLIAPSADHTDEDDLKRKRYDFVKAGFTLRRFTGKAQVAEVTTQDEHGHIIDKKNATYHPNGGMQRLEENKTTYGNRSSQNLYEFFENGKKREEHEKTTVKGMLTHLVDRVYREDGKVEKGLWEEYREYDGIIQRRIDEATDGEGVEMRTIHNFDGRGTLMREFVEIKRDGKEEKIEKFFDTDGNIVPELRKY